MESFELKTEIKICITSCKRVPVVGFIRGHLNFVSPKHQWRELFMEQVFYKLD